MKRVNYKSDFDFLLKLTDASGNELGWPNFDWSLKIYTRNNTSAVFTASCIDGETRNCFDDNGAIHVVCDSHGLGTGLLYGEFYADVPNAIYSDGKQLTVTPFPLGIALVSSAGDEPTTAEVEAGVTAIYINLYELAVMAGYTGTEAEYMLAVTRLPDMVGEADAKVVELGEAIKAANASTEAVAQSSQEAISSTQQQAERAIEAATGQATDAAAAASDAASQATDAAAAASGAAAAASNAATFAQTQGDRAEAAIQATEVLLSEADALAYTDRNNNYTVGQTINGTLTVNGDIVQLGESYITEAEHVKTKNAYVTVREGAVGGLGADERAGIEVKAYDGANDGVIEVGADGVARVGDKGDAQPLLTRAEASELQDGDLLVWDATAQKAVPMQAEIVDMEVTYDDDTTETFQVICKRNGSE